MNKTTLSVVLVAQDEERTIGNVLEAVREWADEIILVDSGSTDKTMQIAESLGARVMHQKWLGYSAQKNLSIEQAKCDWVLSLDADEVVTKELACEIINLLNSGVSPDVAGFRLPRVLFIGDSPVRRGGFYPDAQLRLFRRGQGRFKERIVHEALEVDGDVLKLKHDLHHFAYDTAAEFARTMDKYARLSAQHYFSQGSKAWRKSIINEKLHPLWTFFYRYFIRLGFLEGPLCFRLNLIYADYVRRKISYLRELSAGGTLKDA
ncbi:MAG TPA: glycosyltransferase family 2 protein [Planktothrix sp.]